MTSTSIIEQINSLKDYLQIMQGNCKDDSMKVVRLEIVEHLLSLVIKNLEQISKELSDL